MRWTGVVLLALCLLPAFHVKICEAWSSAILSKPTTSTQRQQHQQQNQVFMSVGTGPSSRAEWLLSAANVVAAVSLLAKALPAPDRCSAVVFGADISSAWPPEGDPKAAASWFPLLKKCYSALEDLLENWEKLTVKQDGDAIRRLIGTIGVSSPLSSLRKAFISVRDAEEESQGDIEVIEFVEAYLEVLTAFGDAENDLYSANFAEYAGGGGMKASQFINKARKSLVIARDNFKEVNRILHI